VLLRHLRPHHHVLPRYRELPSPFRSTAASTPASLNSKRHSTLKLDRREGHHWRSHSVAFVHRWHDTFLLFFSCMYIFAVWRLLLPFKELPSQKNCMAGVVELHPGGQPFYVRMEWYVKFVYNKLSYYKRVQTTGSLVERNEDTNSSCALKHNSW